MNITDISQYIDDRTFIYLDYFTGMRKFPNPKKTFNDKLQWLMRKLPISREVG